MNPTSQAGGAGTAPVFDEDLFSDATIADPYPIYERLRKLGPVAWLAAHDIFVLSGFAEVRDALRNPEIYSSAHGVGFNDMANGPSRGTTLASDGALHDTLRGVLTTPLAMREVRTELTGVLTDEAEALVARLVARGRFDAVDELAWHLPLTVVSRLVGLPEDGRARMRDWAAASFNAFGPLNLRTQAAFPLVGEMIAYISSPALGDTVKPGSWAANVYAALRDGRVAPHQAFTLVLDYVAPSLDTTANAIGNAVWLLAQNPDSWAALRADPSLVQGAVLETLRMESPIRCMGRYLLHDTVVAGARMPAGSRVMLLYAAANRDPAQFAEPDRFDIRRNPTTHLGFGHGAHMCAGMHLAQLEMRAILTALARRSARLELGTPRRMMSNFLRGFESLPITVTQA